MKRKPPPRKIAGLPAAVVLWGSSMGGSVLAMPSGPSQVGIAVNLPVAVIQQRVRDLVVGSKQLQRREVEELGEGGVGARVATVPDAGSLRVSIDAGGALKIGIRINTSIEMISPWEKRAFVEKIGCEPVSYTLSLTFQPLVTEGRVAYGAGAVDARPDSKGYQCEIGTNAAGDLFTNGGRLFTEGRIPRGPRRDVAAAIAAGMARQGQALTKANLERLNGYLPDHAELLQYLRQPVRFGAAIGLGIERPRLEITGVSVDGDDYRLLGRLEGWPRLLFGPDTTLADDGPPPGESADTDGFRLSATLLLPTDHKLVKEPSLGRPSGWLGAFRLQPVQGRPDLAVLQHRAADRTRNLLLLSGGQHGQRPDTRLVFERPMRDVLQQMLEWLADEALWADVDGISELRGEIAAFGRLLEQFQQETQLPLDERGSLRFHSLRVDLQSLWVTNDAILGDVVLNGKADIDLKVLP